MAPKARPGHVVFERKRSAGGGHEGSNGLSDDEIADLARGAGVPEPVIADLGKRLFEPWVAKSTEQILTSGITGTPTVKINGAVFTGDLYSVGPLTQAVAAARGR
jgi:protein-disulfide isomerase